MTAVAVVTVGCTGTDKGQQTTVAGQLPKDTVYTKKAAMSIYGYQPLRALQIVDSAVIVGNLGDVQADQCRARIYGMSLMTDQLDSLNEHGNMLDAFTQIENSVHEATAREHQERVGAIFSKGSEYAKMSSLRATAATGLCRPTAAEASRQEHRADCHRQWFQHQRLLQQLLPPSLRHDSHRIPPRSQQSLTRL